MFVRVLKFSLSVIAVFAVVWIATLLWWQSINRMPTSTDIVTHLFLLPAGMIAAYLVIRGALDGIRRNVVAMRATPAAATEAAQAGGELPETQSDDPTRRWHAPVLASALRSTHGAGAAMTLAALVAQKRPEVDDALHDGNPLYAAPIAELDMDIDATRAALRQIDAELDWSDEAVRMVALAADISQRLLAEAFARYPRLFPVPAAASAPQPEPIHLVLTLLLPRATDPAHQAAAAGLVRQQLAGLWPVDRITLEPLAARGDADALLLLDRAVTTLNRQPERVVRALVAAESLIGQRAVASLRHHDKLFGPDCPHGVVPAEAAAGLLLAPPVASFASEIGVDDASAPTQLGRACVARLDAPSADKGLPRTVVLANLIAQAVNQLTPAAQTPDNQDKHGDNTSAAASDAAEPQPPEIGAVLADIVPHPVRTLEVARVFSDRFPDRDLSTDLLPVGAACGYTGAASALLCVALAHQMTQEAGAPVLAISASDAQQRGAIAMSPPAGADVEAPQDAQDAAAVAA